MHLYIHIERERFGANWSNKNKEPHPPSRTNNCPIIEEVWKCGYNIIENEDELIQVGS